MARQRVDPIFAALARRRPSLSSVHFGLSYQMSDSAESHNPLVPAPRQPVAGPAGESAPEAVPGRAASALRARLGFAVPKRQLARAVDRNALKRVAREAWRHARWGSIQRPCAAMLKLRRADPQWKTTPRGALKKAWRAELDALFERLVARLRSEQHAGQGPQGAGSPGRARSEATKASPTTPTNRTST